MIDIVDLWIENKITKIDTTKEKYVPKKDEITPYRIHQLAINKERIPNEQEYKRISEFNMLRDISSIPEGALLANYVNKVKLPIKASFWYCRSKLHRIDKITTQSVKPNKEKREKIRLIQEYYQCNAFLANEYLNNFIDDKELEKIKATFEQGGYIKDTPSTSNS